MREGERERVMESKDAQKRKLKEREREKIHVFRSEKSTLFQRAWP